MKIFQPRLSRGTVLVSRYQILGEIGQGGMQQVYRALDVSFQREVALKVPINASAQKRFERSAAISAGVVHPNIAKTLDYAVSEGIEFLVEELIPGYDLQMRLDGKIGVLDPHLVAHVMHHIAKAVAAMNSHNVIHRDLKPSNIMVSTDVGMNEIKVTDFGVATMVDLEIDEAVKGGNQSIAASKTVVGALAFMAPELIKKKDGSDRSKCDVWSIGAMTYFLLFHKYPFGDELAAIQNILNGQFDDMSQDAARAKLQFRCLTASLWEIIKKCLVSDVEARPTAAEVASLFSQVTYSNAPRLIGVVKYINQGQGMWGFIQPEDGSEDIFFHFDSFVGGRPATGMRVSYSAFQGAPQMRAFPVVPCGAR